MTRKRYQPGPLADAQVDSKGAGWTLLFTREVHHPIERVWQVLTSPAELRQWAPFDPERDLEQPGKVTLIMAGGAEPIPLPSEVRHAERPHLLEYTWGEDVLRWALSPTATGTRLVLRHTTNDRSMVPKVAAGWHICLDVAERLMAGDPVGRIVAEEARAYGWEALNQQYAATLGISDTGWPDQASQR
jgi:uncharacterized protein YndB with AHSA1/START domain